jgi:Ras-related protein Rab-18
MISVGGARIKLHVWDTPSIEPIVRSYYRGAHAVILVYNIAVRSTFDFLQESWLPYKKHLEEIRQSSQTLVVVALIGYLTWADSGPEPRRAVTFAQGQGFVNDHELDLFIEVSARADAGTDEDVERAFAKVGQRILVRVQEGAGAHFN